MRAPLAMFLASSIAFAACAPQSALAPQATPTTTAATAAGSAVPTPLTPIKMKIALALAAAHAPMMVGLEKGYFRDAGLDIEIITGTYSGAEQMPALLAGSFSYLASSSSGLFAALSQGVPLTVVAIYAGGGDRIALVARKGVSISSAKDLIGKTVAIGARSDTAIAMYAYLAKNGIDVKQLKVVNMDGTEVPAGLAGGSLDAGVTQEPYVSVIETQGTGTIVARGVAMGVGGAWNVIAFPNQYIKQNPEAVDRFLTGLTRSMQFLREQPTDASAAVGKRLTSLKPADLVSSLKFLVWDPRFTEEAMQAFKTSMELQVKLGWLDKLVDLKPVIDESFLRAVQKKHPEYFAGLK